MRVLAVGVQVTRLLRPHKLTVVPLVALEHEHRPVDKVEEEVHVLAVGPHVPRLLHPHELAVVPPERDGAFLMPGELEALAALEHKH